MQLKFKVVRGSQDEYTARAVAAVNISKGEEVASFRVSATLATSITYATVQISKYHHINLNSDVVYLNHSCEPNCRIDVVAMKVIAERNIHHGEELTFFYPSTEWDMAQPFECWCGAKSCLGKVPGAKHMSIAQLTGRFLNKHIMDMLIEAIQQSSP